MSVTELKERLHEAIDSIENTDFLEAMLITGKSQQGTDDGKLITEQLELLREREARYLIGETKPIPWHEVQTRVKEKYGL